MPQPSRAIAPSMQDPATYRIEVSGRLDAGWRG
jgi:hypothetical protein